MKDFRNIVFQVGSGKLRPKPIEDVKMEDKDFVTLYNLCWQQDPVNRPSICTIIQELKKIIASFNVPSAQ
jgi:hypothetical protein